MFVALFVNGGWLNILERLPLASPIPPSYFWCLFFFRVNCKKGTYGFRESHNGYETFIFLSKRVTRPPHPLLYLTFLLLCCLRSHVQGTRLKFMTILPFFPSEHQLISISKLNLSRPASQNTLEQRRDTSRRRIYARKIPHVYTLSLK